MDGLGIYTQHMLTSLVLLMGLHLLHRLGMTASTDRILDIRWCPSLAQWTCLVEWATPAYPELVYNWYTLEQIPHLSDAIVEYYSIRPVPSDFPMEYFDPPFDW